MPQAVFHEPFNYTSRRKNAGWAVQPSDKPQSYPQELITAATAAGVATAVEPKGRGKSKEAQTDG